MKKIFFYTIIFLTFSCTPSKRFVKTNTLETYQFPYNLHKADLTFDLPDALKEISGIALTKDEQEIIAIQDENGILFYLDRGTGKVLREQKFHKDGDYEDIAVVQNDIYIIKSNGSLYQLEPTDTDSLHRTKYKIGNKEQDFEGLCYDKKNAQLLVACKGVLSKDKAYEKHKGICAFDLKTKTLKANPAFSINLEAIEQYLNLKGSPEMREKFSKIMSENNGQLGFSPSGIAIHPLSENIYVISSKGKTLAVLSQNNQILHLEKLDKKIHCQPEGILFDTNGTLYISNEGKAETAKLYRFDLN